MPSKTFGAKGSMILSSHWHEDSSGYNQETTTTEELRASDDGRQVFLVCATETSPPNSGPRAEIYSISAQALSAWIRREGTVMK